MNDQIIIRGAREHNLRNVSLTVPRDKPYCVFHTKNGIIYITFLYSNDYRT